MEEKQAIHIFSALAQESRLRVFRRLVRSGEREIAAGQLARELELPAATLSFHLKELRSAGLIRDRREGRRILYSLDTDCLQSFIQFLLNDCCDGRRELCQPFVELLADQDSASSH